MNFYEEYIIKLQKRIKKIDEDPDPSKLKSNKLRYELEIETTKQQLKAWQEGRPFSDGGSATAAILTYAMGFAPMGAVQPAFQTTAPQKYLERARMIGLPVDKSCDMTMMPFAMTECGDLPMEDVSICDHHCCTPMGLRGIYVAHSSKSMTYFIDRGVEENEATLKYVTDQIGEFIEWAEKMFPGVIKYDEDKLIELQLYADAARPIQDEIHEMAKHKPSPISGRGGGGGGGPGSVMTPKGIQLLKARRDEIAERIEKGLWAVPDEKLRVLWCGVTNPVFMDPYKVLAKWGIATPLGLGGATFGRLTRGVGFWSGKKLTPLEKVAARSISDYRGGLGHVYVDELIWSARDLQADAVIHYNMRGCTAALGLRKILEDRLEQELGIPTLQLEGAQWDTSYASEAQITSNLDEFAQLLLNQRNLA